MEEFIIHQIENMNIAQLIAIALIGWWFYRRLEGKIVETKKDLKEETSSLKKDLKEEISKLAIKVEDVDRRLCRIEGSLSTQGHCLFNQSHKEKQAE